MATPYSVILKKFTDNLSETEANKLELAVRRQFLRNAISFYVATIGTITPNSETQEIAEDLKETELLLLSLLMYDAYLEQEILKYNRIINISNEFMKMTGATDRVKVLKEMKALNQQRIDIILSSLL